MPKLIKELGIDQISKQLKLEDKEELYKQCVIMAYVESKINLTKHIETNIATANMNGVNIEVGKLIELFLYQNNIEYNLKCGENSARKNIIYRTKIGESTVCLCPAHLYNSDVNNAGILIRGTHYVEKKEGNVLISSLNAKMYKTYLHLINQARIDVLQASINEICRVNQMDVDRFMQEPIANMKRYAPEINIDHIAMKTLVRATQDKLQKNSEEKIAKIDTNNEVNYRKKKLSLPPQEGFSEGR